MTNFSTHFNYNFTCVEKFVNNFYEFYNWYERTESDGTADVLNLKSDSRFQIPIPDAVYKI